MRALLFMLLASMAMLAAPSAFAGSGYAPPASGGGVSGSGSGITDASSFRTALGLGTLATENSPYAADTWDYEWTAGASAMTSDGWTLIAGGGVPTDTAGTYNGIPFRTLTPPGVGVVSYVYHDLPAAPDGSFEFRFLASQPAASSTHLYFTTVNASAAGINKRPMLGVTATGPAWYNGTGAVADATTMGNLVNKWIWFTVRVINGGAGTGTAEIWLGGTLVWSGYGSSFRAISTAGRIEFGKLSSALNVTPTSIAKVQYRAGWNEAPPSYTFRALNGAVGP